MNRGRAAAFGVVVVNLLTLATVLAVGGGTDPSDVPDLVSQNGLALLGLEGLKLANGVLLVVVIRALRDRFAPDRIVDTASLMGGLAAVALAVSSMLGTYLLVTGGAVGLGSAAGGGGGSTPALIGAIEAAGDVALAASGLFYLGVNGQALRGGRQLQRRTAIVGCVAGLLALLAVVVPTIVGLPLLVSSCVWYWLVGQALASKRAMIHHPEQTGT